jgi:hypothetical protein
LEAEKPQEDPPMSNDFYERPNKGKWGASFILSGVVATASIFVCLWKLASAFDLL